MTEVKSFLYAVRMLIPNLDPHPIKIGFSTNPNNRMRHYDAGPYPCEWLGVWPGTIDDERAFHATFRSIRLSGEWFAPNEEFLQAINENIKRYQQSLTSPALLLRMQRQREYAMAVLETPFPGPEAA